VKATGDHAGKFTSSSMVNRGTFGYTFGDTAGIFEYTDPNFPGMNGTINVVKGAAVVGAPTVQSAASP
jgi:hypothetical protein